MEITVGIPTVGTPRFRKESNGLTRLENMLIGKDFHWQRTISVLLPGLVIIAGREADANEEDMEYRVRNSLPVETYLRCVVGSEMNPKAPPEFLKAHAIISRSWAVGKILRVHPENDEGRMDCEDTLIGWDDTSSHHGFHVCSDDHCQRYQGVQNVAEEMLEALEETENIVLTDKRGVIIDARFSKCCGGQTELFSTCWQDREMPALESFEDPWCNLGNKRREVLAAVLKDYDLGSDGGYRWTAQLTKSEIKRNLLIKFGKTVGKIERLSPVRRGPSGRISLLEIKGSSGKLRLGKELWIRRLLSDSHLFSSAFEIVDNGDYVVLHGKGWGHGVGLCQIGAANMALQGASCGEILSFYYPGCRLSDLSEIEKE